MNPRIILYGHRSDLVFLFHAPPLLRNLSPPKYVFRLLQIKSLVLFAAHHDIQALNGSSRGSLSQIVKLGI